MRSRVDLHGGEAVTLNSNDPGNYALSNSIETNSWDQWNSDRDQALQADAANQTQATDSFVNSQNPAWNDLNANGNWYDVPGQGYVWSPFAAAYSGWDPYGCGQWMWMPGWGYSWVSCYTWGYMPYSCGMWNYYSSFGWGWSPGISGCSPWWGGGYGGGYVGYYGPNIGNAPSGYRPVIRPPKVIHPPRGRFPRPVVVDRVPEGRHPGRRLRQVDAPVTIAGHRVQPLKPMPVRGGFVRTAPGFVTEGAHNNQGMRVHGGEARRPMPIYGSRRGYTPTAPVRTVNSPSRQAERGYQPPRNYSPPVHTSSALFFTPRAPLSSSRVTLHRRPVTPHPRPGPTLHLRCGVNLVVASAAEAVPPAVGASTVVAFPVAAEASMVEAPPAVVASMVVEAEASTAVPLPVEVALTVADTDRASLLSTPPCGGTTLQPTIAVS